jgi:hypothetical protein
MATKEERIAAVNHRRLEVREQMFELEENDALAMIERFTREVKKSNLIVKRQRAEREKMFDRAITQIESEEEE